MCLKCYLALNKFINIHTYFNVQIEKESLGALFELK